MAAGYRKPAAKAVWPNLPKRGIDYLAADFGAEIEFTASRVCCSVVVSEFVER